MSIKQILDDITDHPLMKDVTLERVVKHSIDFMRILGVPQIFENKVEKLEVKNHKALLPCDFYQMNQVKLLGNCPERSKMFRYTTDSFHLEDKYHGKNIDLTYMIQNSVIFTSIEEGEIEISYQAVMTDNDGYPLIPDNGSFANALELYIKLKVFTYLFDTGKISQAVYQNTQQEYSWAVGQASNQLKMVTLDQMESLSNIWSNLLIRAREHKYGFINTGTKELLRNH